MFAMTAMLRFGESRVGDLKTVDEMELTLDVAGETDLVADL